MPDGSRSRNSSGVSLPPNSVKVRVVVLGSSGTGVANEIIRSWNIDSTVGDIKKQLSDTIRQQTQDKYDVDKGSLRYGIATICNDDDVQLKSLTSEEEIVFRVECVAADEGELVSVRAGDGAELDRERELYDDTKVDEDQWRRQALSPQIPSTDAVPSNEVSGWEETKQEASGDQHGSGHDAARASSLSPDLRPPSASKTGPSADLTGPATSSRFVQLVNSLYSSHHALISHLITIQKQQPPQQPQEFNGAYVMGSAAGEIDGISAVRQRNSGVRRRSLDESLPHNRGPPSARPPVPMFRNTPVTRIHMQGEQQQAQENQQDLNASQNGRSVGEDISSSRRRSSVGQQQLNDDGGLDLNDGQFEEQPEDIEMDRAARVLDRARRDREREEELRLHPAGNILRLFDFKLLVKLVGLVFLLGHEDSPSHLILLSAAALVAYLIKTGIANALWQYQLGGRGQANVAATSRGLARGGIQQGGGRIRDMQYFFSSFVLSLFPAWRPVRAANPVIININVAPPVAAAGPQ